ncbi:C1QL3 protein, partial [Menura novaehollandiae]|nr:C1QL3 protein [Menura novaehollandiae]
MVLLLVILIPVLVSSAGTSAHYEMLGTCRMVCDPYGGTKAPSTAATPDRGLMQLWVPRGSAMCPGVPVSPELRGAPAGPPAPRAAGGRGTRRAPAAQQVPQRPSRPGAQGAARRAGGSPGLGEPGASAAALPGMSALRRGRLRHGSAVRGVRRTELRTPCPRRGARSFARLLPRRARPAHSPLCSAHTGAAADTSAIAQDADQNYDYASNSVVLHLEPGDEVYIKLDGGKAHGGNNNKYSTFSGFIIYAD